MSLDYLKFLAADNWHIDQNYGLKELAKYMGKLNLMENGASFDDLGFKEQREQSKEFHVLSAEGEQSDPLKQPSEIKSTQGQIALMSFTGVMRMDDSMYRVGVRTFADQLRQVANQPSIDGVLLYLETGGGEAMAGFYLYEAIKEIDKPVVVHSPYLGSAGYLAAAAADKVIANGEAAEFGSIGVLISIDRNFIAWYKENILTLYSSKSPDKNAISKALMSNDHDTVVKFLDESADQFHKVVQKNRNLGNSAESTLKGAMFPALKARSRGLIDGIGGRKYAIKRLNSEIKYQKA